MFVVFLSEFLEVSSEMRSLPFALGSGMFAYYMSGGMRGAFESSSKLAFLKTLKPLLATKAPNDHFRARRGKTISNKCISKIINAAMMSAHLSTKCDFTAYLINVSGSLAQGHGNLKTLYTYFAASHIF